MCDPQYIWVLRFSLFARFLAAPVILSETKLEYHIALENEFEFKQSMVNINLLYSIPSNFIALYVWEFYDFFNHCLGIQYKPSSHARNISKNIEY